MKYFLGSSFFENGRHGRDYRHSFSLAWHYNNLKMPVQPSRTVVICEAGSRRPTFAGVDNVNLSGDLGSIGQHLHGEKKFEFTGWSAAMLALAMLAYVDESDFVYKEEDCLFVGDCVAQAYKDMGDGSMVFGRKMTSAPWQACAQSFFIVKHDFIPTFVSEYISLGRDGTADNVGELKFVKLEQAFGTNLVRRLSFGIDRERSMPFDDPVWYVQQVTPEELGELNRRKLV